MEMKKNIFRVFVLAGLLCCGCRDGFTVRQALERAGENRPQLEAVLEHFKESGDRYILYYWDGVHQGHAQYICDDSRRAVYTDQDIQVQILLCQVWIL